MEQTETTPQTINQSNSQEVKTGSNPWLKYGLIIFLILALINGILYFVFLRNSEEGLFTNELIDVKDESGFLITNPDKVISREGYSIIFSNPRYENLETQSFFRVDITLTNDSFQPTINTTANCDIEEKGLIVRQGAGVSVESGESKPVLPGSSNSWTALIVLENNDQKVTSCLYAPEGIFDPTQTVRVVF